MQDGSQRVKDHGLLLLLLLLLFLLPDGVVRAHLYNRKKMKQRHRFYLHRSSAARLLSVSCYIARLVVVSINPKISPHVCLDHVRTVKYIASNAMLVMPVSRHLLPSLTTHRFIALSILHLELTVLPLFPPPCMNRPLWTGHPFT